jgi:hypothetical protein
MDCQSQIRVLRLTGFTISDLRLAMADLLRIRPEVLGRIFERLQLPTIAFVWLHGVKVKDF